MISICDDCGFVGEQSGLMSSDWMIVIKQVWVNNKKTIVFASVCPTCAEKYRKSSKPSKTYGAYLKSHKYEEGD
jgi:ribosomal protein S17